MTRNWHKAIKNRTSVRRFSGSVDQKTYDELNKFAATLGNDEARLVLRAKDGVLKSIFLAYGKVTGTICFAAVVTKTNSKYMGGYIGEAFVLECASRGIATCWLGASYKKSKVSKFVSIKDDETIACIIAFGVYDGKIKHTNKKSIEQLTGLSASEFSALPAWQQEAVNCARLAPSALNKQPWELAIKAKSIELINNSDNWGFGEIDCGIAMLHLELGANYRDVYGEWKFANTATEFVPFEIEDSSEYESDYYDEEEEFSEEAMVESEEAYNFSIGHSEDNV